MKKILFSIALLLGTLSLFAQRQSDLKVTLLEPATGDTFRTGDMITFKIEFKNLGSASWQVDDSIAFASNILQGTYLFKVKRVVPANDTQLLVISTTPIQVDDDFTTDICALAVFVNNEDGPNYIIDSDSTNNLSCNDSIVFIAPPPPPPVGTNDVNIASKTLNVYPNPATNEIAFNYDGFTSKPFDILIMDMTGRTIISKTNIQGNDRKVNIEGLTNGIYQIHILQGGEKYIGKFAKQ